MTQLPAWDNDHWDNASWNSPPVVAASNTRLTVQHVHNYPPQPPPPPLRPQIVYVTPPAPPKTDDLFEAFAAFAFGVLLIAFVTGFSIIWFAIVATFCGGVALIWGFSQFIEWTERYSRSQGR